LWKCDLGLPSHHLSPRQLQQWQSGNFPIHLILVHGFNNIATGFFIVPHVITGAFKQSRILYLMWQKMYFFF
jgi:hypothetical protein